jgi:5-methylthioadenosine/S-adenosylhomocysteine deaminase
MALTVIEHGYVIPVSTNQLIEDGVVAFEDTRIIYVGPSSKLDRRKFTPTSTINARDARANPLS